MAKNVWPSGTFSVGHKFLGSFCSANYNEWIFFSPQSRHYGYQKTQNYSVAEPHHFYAAPAPGKHFDAAPDPAAPAPAPTLLYSKAKFLKRTKV
jgi:hypothetical protein